VMEVRGAGVWVGLNTVMSHSATLRVSFYQICDQRSWLVPRVSGPTHAIENRIQPLLFFPQIHGGPQIFFRHHRWASLSLGSSGK
jgi:hypothetical protein